jgi:hypothetical protein
MRGLSPVGAVWRGALAGAFGTIAMDLLWFYRYKRDGGESGFSEWELSGAPSSWEAAPAPAQIGRRLFEALFERQIALDRVALVNNVMHWSYGLCWGTAYGILAGSLAPLSRLWAGLAFGSTVWAGDYVILPLAKVYKPIWEYEANTLWDDLSAHLVFGAATATAFRSLLRGVGQPVTSRVSGAPGRHKYFAAATR